MGAVARLKGMAARFCFEALLRIADAALRSQFQRDLRLGIEESPRAQLTRQLAKMRKHLFAELKLAGILVFAERFSVALKRPE